MKAEAVMVRDVITVKPDDAAASAIKLLVEQLDRPSKQPWTDFGSRNIIVPDGVVHVRRLVASPEEHKALIALAEEVPDVRTVSDEAIPAY